MTPEQGQWCARCLDSAIALADLVLQSQLVRRKEMEFVRLRICHSDAKREKKARPAPGSRKLVWL
jgi:hypothetical protein